MAVYISQGAVMKHLGPASPADRLGVASVAARCWRCALYRTAAIRRHLPARCRARRRHRLLYSGPAINVMAIVVTAKVLGAELRIARAVGAIVLPW